MEKEYIPYIMYRLAKGNDTDELTHHLSMNGYRFGFDPKSNALFIYEDETEYVETIMHDRKIKYEMDTP